MARYTSYGNCSLCGKRTSKAAMSRHVRSCSASRDLSTGKAERLFLIRVEDLYSPVFWLDLEIKAGATLSKLDDFLRETWVECCGHLSSFDVAGSRYTAPFAMDLAGGFEERDMEVELGEVLRVGTSMEYIYDFGTSTELKLRAMDEREGCIGGREPLRLLSRNEAPEWPCAVCDGVAALICTYCMYETESPFYCEEHAMEHDCGDEACLPVVNSPRMGMCGFTGPPS